MESKGKRVLIITLATMITLTMSLLMAQEEKMVLDASKVSMKKGRPVVNFPHEQHIGAGLECKACHHIYRDGKNVLDESRLEAGSPDIRCSKCHGVAFRLSLQKAFHGQCIGCHVIYWKEKKKTGPRYCGACHIRK